MRIFHAYSTTDSISRGETASLSFDLFADMFGMGVLLAVDDANANATWTLAGETHPPNEDDDIDDPNGSGTSTANNTTPTDGSGGTGGVNSVLGLHGGLASGAVLSALALGFTILVF